MKTEIQQKQEEQATKAILSKGVRVKELFSDKELCQAIHVVTTTHGTTINKVVEAIQVSILHDIAFNAEPDVIDILRAKYQFAAEFLGTLETLAHEGKGITGEQQNKIKAKLADSG